MLRILITVLAICISWSSPAQPWKPIEQASSINFSINNFGLSTKGSFKGLNGSIVWNLQDLSASSFNITVDANTINTDNKLRDGHLRKEDYFDVAKFSSIIFHSTKISTTATAGVYLVEAQLTIKGTTKLITFPFKAMPSKTGAIFKGNFELNRRDFGVGGGSISLSNTVKIQLVVTTQ